MNKNRKILCIPNNNNKPDLHTLFAKHLESSNKHIRTLYDDWGYDDFPYNYMDDDEYAAYIRQLYEDCGMTVKSSKNKKKGSDKYNKNKSSSKNDSVPYHSIFGENKQIYYYRDVNNPDDYEVFNCISDFANFLDEEGIDMSDDSYNKLLTQEVSHCCIDPYMRESIHMNYIYVDNSYGSLRWACSEVE